MHPQEEEEEQEDAEPPLSEVQVGPASLQTRSPHCLNRPSAATSLLSIQMHTVLPPSLHTYIHTYIHTGSAPGTYNHAVQSCARSVSVSVRVHQHCLARCAHIIHLPLHKGRDPNEQELVVIMSRLNELSKIPAPASGTAALLGGLTARAGIASWRIVLVLVRESLK